MQIKRLGSELIRRQRGTPVGMPGNAHAQFSRAHKWRGPRREQFGRGGSTTPGADWKLIGLGKKNGHYRPLIYALIYAETHASGDPPPGEIEVSNVFMCVCVLTRLYILDDRVCGICGPPTPPAWEEFRRRREVPSRLWTPTPRAARRTTCRHLLGRRPENRSARYCLNLFIADCYAFCFLRNNWQCASGANEPPAKSNKRTELLKSIRKNEVRYSDLTDRVPYSSASSDGFEVRYVYERNAYILDHDTATSRTLLRSENVLRQHVNHVLHYAAPTDPQGL